VQDMRLCPQEETGKEEKKEITDFASSLSCGKPRIFHAGFSLDARIAFSRLIPLLFGSTIKTETMLRRRRRVWH